MKRKLVRLFRPRTRFCLRATRGFCTPQTGVTEESDLPPRFADSEAATDLLERASKDGLPHLASAVVNQMVNRGMAVSEHQAHLTVHAHARNGVLADAYAAIDRMPDLGLERSSDTFEIMAWAICLRATSRDQLLDFLTRMQTAGVEPTSRILSLLLRASARIRDFESMYQLLDRFLFEADKPGTEDLLEKPASELATDLVDRLQEHVDKQLWQHPEVLEALLSLDIDTNAALRLVHCWIKAADVVTEPAIRRACEIVELTTAFEISPATMRRAQQILEGLEKRGLDDDQLFRSATAILAVLETMNMRGPGQMNMEQAFVLFSEKHRSAAPSLKFLDLIGKLCVRDVDNFKELVKRVKDSLVKMETWSRTSKEVFLATVFSRLERAHSSPLVPWEVGNEFQMKLSASLVQALNTEGIDMRKFSSKRKWRPTNVASGLPNTEANQTRAQEAKAA